MKMTSYSIGELARLGKVSVQALRLYERKGLLKAQRQPNGYRAYDSAGFLRLETIKQLQGLGFTLKEMGGIFQDGRRLWENPRMRLAVQKKLREIRGQIEGLQRLEAGLKKWKGESRGKGDGTD